MNVPYFLNYFIDFYRLFVGIDQGQIHNNESQAPIKSTVRYSANKAMTQNVYLTLLFKLLSLRRKKTC